MVDIADRAKEADDRFREQALARARASLPAAGPDGAATCRLCGDEIPLARRRAVPASDTCTYCQSELERASRR